MAVLRGTLNLLKSIDSGGIIGGNFRELVELARLNKVLLGFLRRINYDGTVRTLEEERYREYVGSVISVTRALNGIDYALFKFRKPLEHVSVDIDVLIRSEQLARAARKLSGLGFGIEVIEPYTVTMIRGKAIVDLYTYPSFASIIYLDGQRLLEEAEEIEVEGRNVRALTREAEALATAAHAIYKEHMYLLADYYVIKQWMNSKAVNLAKELNVEEAVKISIRLNRQIEQSLMETPIKLKPMETAKILTDKFIKDQNFRATTINTIKLATRKRSIRLLVYRVKRRSY